jgi:hypothetical protein
MRYKPKVGNDFPVRQVKEQTRYLTEFTRSTIAISVVVAAILALLVAAAIGAYHGEFSALRTLWSVISLPLGLVIGHYFRGAGKGDDENYQSSA